MDSPRFIACNQEELLAAISNAAEWNRKAKGMMDEAAEPRGIQRLRVGHAQPLGIGEASLDIISAIGGDLDVFVSLRTVSRRTPLLHLMVQHDGTLVMRRTPSVDDPLIATNPSGRICLVEDD